MKAGAGVHGREQGHREQKSKDQEPWPLKSGPGDSPEQVDLGE